MRNIKSFNFFSLKPQHTTAFCFPLNQTCAKLCSSTYTNKPAGQTYHLYTESHSRLNKDLAMSRCFLALRLMNAVNIQHNFKHANSKHQTAPQSEQWLPLKWWVSRDCCQSTGPRRAKCYFGRRRYITGTISKVNTAIAWWQVKHKRLKTTSGHELTVYWW